MDFAFQWSQQNQRGQKREYSPRHGDATAQQLNRLCHQEWNHPGEWREAENTSIVAEATEDMMRCSQHHWIQQKPERQDLNFPVYHETKRRRAEHVTDQWNMSEHQRQENMEEGRESSAANRGCSESTKPELQDPYFAPELRPRRSLSEDDVIAIFLAGKPCEGTSKMTMQNRGQILALSREFNVTPKTIRDIWNRRTWRSVTSRVISTCGSLDSTAVCTILSMLPHPPIRLHCNATAYQTYFQHD